MAHDGQISRRNHLGCCNCDSCGEDGQGGLTRRDFLKAGGVALGGVALSGLTWASLSAQAAEGGPASVPAAFGPAAGRKPLIVKPILSYEVPGRREQTSWRNWGGIATPEQAAEEVARLKGEYEKIAATGGFPVKFLDVSPVRNAAEAEKALAGAAEADAVILCAAGDAGQGTFQAVAKSGKDMIIFLRHRSGPVYLWYEIVSPRFLHQHGDKLAVKGVDNQDVVVDSMEEMTWRLRALCGLKNTLGTRILAVGGAGAWSGSKVPEMCTEKLKFDIRNVDYADLAKLLKDAFADAATVAAAKRRAEEYLKDPAVKLETKREYVENAFVLDQVFRALMAKAECTAITVNACMGTIMPMSKTTACLTLSTLNDAGYLAFCESDFVVIPAATLLARISGQPHFMNDPTYPHAGVITLAHCTAPRRMNGKDLEPVRLLTHFESDYGAAPKVEMRKGQKVTSIIPDFAMQKWVGLGGEIVDVPFLPICRSQIDVGYKVPDEKVAQNMPGFHWDTIYGDYLRECAYALKKTPIGWECLG